MRLDKRKKGVYNRGTAVSRKADSKSVLPFSRNISLNIRERIVTTMNHSRSKKARKRQPIPGIVLSVLLLAAAAVFVWLLSMKQMLKNTYVLVAEGA